MQVTISDEAIATVARFLLDHTHPLRPGTVVVIPAGVRHSLDADPGQELEFVIFGTPPMTMDDERAKPVKA
jgi:quercetin dioxygenase-like cupin family protein